LRIDLGDFEEEFDGLVRLLVEQEIQALEIGTRQGPRFMDNLPHVHTGGSPAHGEKHRDQQELPVFRTSSFIVVSGKSGSGGCSALSRARLRRAISRR
jgi:hypothetical protein